MLDSDVHDQPRRLFLPPHIRRIALVLQGGGALGAFQAGVYERLAQGGYLPDWIAGTSIGAINAALIAGNPPEQRADRLREFWNRISRPEWTLAPAWNHPMRLFYNNFHATLAATTGQPGFFEPRFVNPLFATPGSDGAISLYNTSALAETLSDLIDFHRINTGPTRLCLGAVNIRTGQQTYFDSRSQPLELKHVLASAALPPAFAPVEIDGEHYWDGGVVSNTPLEVVLEDNPRRSTLCFMVDLFDCRGKLPTNLDEVQKRQKDIMYASRSERNIEAYEKIHQLRHVINSLYGHMPESLRNDPEIRELASWGCTTTMSIIHMIYRGTDAESAAEDYEFSRASIRDHWDAGRRDAEQALAKQQWLIAPKPEQAVVLEEIPGLPPKAG